MKHAGNFLYYQLMFPVCEVHWQIFLHYTAAVIENAPCNFFFTSLKIKLINMCMPNPCIHVPCNSRRFQEHIAKTTFLHLTEPRQFFLIGFDPTWFIPKLPVTLASPSLTLTGTSLTLPYHLWLSLTLNDSLWHSVTFTDSYHLLLTLSHTHGHLLNLFNTPWLSLTLSDSSWVLPTLFDSLSLSPSVSQH